MSKKVDKLIRQIEIAGAVVENDDMFEVAINDVKKTMVELNDGKPLKEPTTWQIIKYGALNIVDQIKAFWEVFVEDNHDR